MIIAQKFFIFAILLMVPSVASGQEAAPAPLNVLFIGNSYTSVNDLPAMVEGLANASGGRKIRADRHLVGGCTLGPWTKAGENPIAATNLDIGVSGPGHSCITLSPDGSEMFVVYHAHADAKKPSGDRVVNIDRIGFDESGKLRITGPTRSPQPIPSGSR